MTIIASGLDANYMKLVKEIKKQTDQVDVISFMFSLSFCIDHAAALIQALQPKYVIFYTQEKTIFRDYFRRDRKKFGLLEASFEKLDEDRLKVNIQGSIVQNYTEQFVDLRKLSDNLSSNYRAKYFLGSSYDGFLSPVQQQFSNLYVAGHFKRIEPSKGKEGYLQSGKLRGLEKINDGRDLYTLDQQDSDLYANMLRLSRIVLGLGNKPTSRSFKEKVEKENAEASQEMKIKILSELLKVKITLVQNQVRAFYSTRSELFFYFMNDRVYLMLRD